MLRSILRLIRVFTLTASHARKIKRISSQRIQNWQDLIVKIKKDWAKASLENLGLKVETLGAVVSDEPMIFVGNHLSYLDIPLVMTVAPVSFVAKIELSRWPVIGEACRSVGTVFVKRDSVDSRRIAIQKIGEACLEKKQSICLFPSGTTTLSEEKPWRKGAFEIAKIHKLKIQPFRIKYEPCRIAAFVGNDAFVPHLWRLLRTKQVRAQIEFHSPIEVANPEVDCLYWQKWCQEILTEN